MRVQAFICDGCHIHEPITEHMQYPWVDVLIRPWQDKRTNKVKGDFHSLDCLAKFVASDDLDRKIKAA